MRPSRRCRPLTALGLGLARPGGSDPVAAADTSEPPSRGLSDHLAQATAGPRCNCPAGHESRSPGTNAGEHSGRRGPSPLAGSAGRSSVGSLVRSMHPLPVKEPQNRSLRNRSPSLRTGAPRTQLFVPDATLDRRGIQPASRRCDALVAAESETARHVPKTVRQCCRLQLGSTPCSRPARSRSRAPADRATSAGRSSDLS